MKNMKIVLRRAELLGAIATNVELKRVKCLLKAARVRTHHDVSPEYTQAMCSLAEHRQVRRFKARVAGLAYAFVRGKKYREVERKTSLSAWQLTCLTKAVADAALTKPETILAWFNEGTSG
jgi:hypothetical protein